MNLFELAAKLTLDKGEFDKGMDDSEKEASNFGQKLAAALGTAGKVAAGAIAAVGTGVIAAGTAMVKAAGETAAYGDNIDKMSQKLGLSAEAYQEWDFIMQHSGTTIEGMSRGMTTLNKAAESGSDAFSKLGISQEEVASLNQEQLFARTIEALQGMEAGSERAVLAQELLGGAAKELGPLLNTSAEDTEAMRQQVHELGGVMSDEAVKAAAAYQDSLQNMQTAFSGLQRGLTSEFMPGITTVMDGLTAIFSGDSEGGLSAISEGISSLVSNISKQIPRIVEIGSGIVTSLLTAITQNLPTLLSAGADMVIQIGQGLLENLPQIVQAGLEVIVTLAQSITDSIPEMIPTIIDVVMNIVDTLIDNVPLLLEAAIEIIIGLTEGIIENLPQLIERIPEIIERTTEALIEAVPMLLEAAIEIIVMLGTFIIQELPRLIAMIPKIITGIISKLVELAKELWTAAKELIHQLAEGLMKHHMELIKKQKEIIDKVKTAITDKVRDFLDAGTQLVKGIWNGISNAAQWLWDQIAGFASGIVSKFKAFLGIRSPSKVMRDQIGLMIGRGVGFGIMDAIPDVEKAVGAVNDAIMSTEFDIPAVGVSGATAASMGVSGTSGLFAAGAGAGSTREQYSPHITIEFTGDLAQLGRLLQPVISAEGVRIGGNLVTA